MFLLLIIVIVLVILITVTYGKDLQCDDDDRNNQEHTRRKNSSTESNNLISFLLFSDVHLDQFYKATAGIDSFCRNESEPSAYNAPYGRIGCDSPLRLLNDALNAMKKQANNLPNLDFIMLSGKEFSQYKHRRNNFHLGKKVRKFWPTEI